MSNFKEARELMGLEVTPEHAKMIDDGQRGMRELQERLGLPVSKEPDYLALAQEMLSKRPEPSVSEIVGSPADRVEVDPYDNEYTHDINGRLRSSYPIWHLSRFHPSTLAAQLQAAAICAVGVSVFFTIIRWWNMS